MKTLAAKDDQGGNIMKERVSVLVVDDEKGFRDLLSYELSAHGYRVVTAVNGKHALSRMRESKFQLVICDIKMPKLGGIETLEAIKKMDPDVEVIMATGYGALETAVAAMKNGACDYLGKPINLDELLAVIHKALQKSELKTILAVYQSSKEVFSSIRPQVMLPNIMRLALKILQADDISVLQSKQGKLEVLASSGVETDEGIRTRVTLSERVLSMTFPSDEPVLINGSLERDPRFSGISGRGDIKAFLLQPLMVGGEVLGAVTVNRTASAEPFRKADRRHLTIFGSQISQAIHNANTSGRLEDAVSKLDAAFSELDEMQTQLVHAEKLSSIGRLAASVAHELNNPLTALLGFTQVLLERGELSSDQRESVEFIGEQGQRCSKIIRDLMQFSRKSRLERKSISLLVPLEAALELTRFDLTRSGITVIRKWVDPPPQVAADPFRLQQVFLNLITNALHAMASGGIKRLTVRVAVEGGKALVQFKDTGCGIPDDQLGKVFEPFFTTKPVEKGTGLGLSVSSRIVSEHGGVLRVSSAGEEGATFTVELPLDEGLDPARNENNLS